MMMPWRAATVEYALRQPRRPESVEPLSGGTATAGVERPLSFR